MEEASRSSGGRGECRPSDLVHSSPRPPCWGCTDSSQDGSLGKTEGVGAREATTQVLLNLLSGLLPKWLGLGCPWVPGRMCHPDGQALPVQDVGRHTTYGLGRLTSSLPKQNISLALKVQVTFYILSTPFLNFVNTVMLESVY